MAFVRLFVIACGHLQLLLHNPPANASCLATSIMGPCAASGKRGCAGPPRPAGQPVAGVLAGRKRMRLGRWVCRRGDPRSALRWRMAPGSRTRGADGGGGLRRGRVSWTVAPRPGPPAAQAL